LASFSARETMTHPKPAVVHSENFTPSDTDCPHPTAEESKRIWEAWFQAMELSHAMLLAGLRTRMGSEADLEAAYRIWSDRYHEMKWEADRAS
jgi:hypothetical protein